MGKNLNGTKLNNDKSSSVSGNEGFDTTEDYMMKFIQNENLRYVTNNIPAARGMSKSIYLYRRDKNGITSIHDNLLKSIVENLSSLIDMGSKNKTRKYKESLMAFGYSCGIIKGYTYKISSSNSSLNEMEKCLEEVLEMMYSFFVCK